MAALDRNEANMATLRGVRGGQPYLSIRQYFARVPTP